MPRKRHVSRNTSFLIDADENLVMPRKRHVSRNTNIKEKVRKLLVMPRKRHVSRNWNGTIKKSDIDRHASQEACE